MKPCLKRPRVSKHPIDKEPMLFHTEKGSENLIFLEPGSPASVTVRGATNAVSVSLSSKAISTGHRKVIHSKS